MMSAVILPLCIDVGRWFEDEPAEHRRVVALRMVGVET